MAQKVSLTFMVTSPTGGTQEVKHLVDLPGVIKLGKLESSHLRLDDEGVSRMHAIIEVSEQGEIHLIDLGSATGTFVNGQKINKYQLRSNDEIRVGNTTIRVAISMVEVAGQPSHVAPPAKPVGDGLVAPVSVLPQFNLAGPTSAAGSSHAQAAPQQVAYMPVNDPSVDVQDGTRSVEVTALLRDNVVGVRLLTGKALGKPRGSSLGIAAIGWLIFAGGAVMAIGSGLGSWHQSGVAALLCAVGVACGTFGLLRIFDDKKSPDYRLGTDPDADLHLSHPAIPVPSFPLVHVSNGEFQLNFTPQMDGDITVGADRIPLKQLIDQRRANPSSEVSGAYAMAIPNDARIKLDLGESVFLVNSVPPARTIVAPFLSRVDWRAQAYNGLSFLAHALVLFLLFFIPPDAKSLSLDLFNADNQFTKFLIKPPEEKEEEVPDWLKKKGPDEAGGKGQRHKGDEGKMGKKTSQNKTGLYGLKGPKDADPHLAKKLAEEQAENAGVLGTLKSAMGSHIASIFGQDSAIGNDAEDALGGLIGNQIGEAYGTGGLGVIGTGSGGGGTGEGTIGLGTLGTIGKGGGGGSGSGYGRGAGRLGGRSALVPNVLAGQAEVKGALDKEIIRRIIRQNMPKFKFCYQKELQAAQSLEGRVVIKFTISATGQVATAAISETSLNNSAVEQCMAQAMRRLEFPKPKGGGFVIVSYPFVLRTAGGE